MFGRKVEHMLMARITQKGTPLHASAQVLGDKGHLAPLGHQTTDVKAPMGIEGIHHPVVTVHVGQLLEDLGQMGGEIGAGAGLAHMPHAPTRGHDKRGDQRPCAMTDVLGFAFFRLARGHRLWGVCARKNLHAGLFSRADDHTALLKEAQGVQI